MGRSWIAARRWATLGVLGVLAASCATSPAPPPAREEGRGEDAAGGDRDRAPSPPPAEDPSPAEDSPAARADGPIPPKAAGERPGAAPAGTQPGSATDAGARRAAVSPADVRAAVARAATSRARSTEGIAGALRAIADLLGRAAGDSPAVARALANLRAETDALVRLDAIDLDRADRVKSALREGTEAVRSLARARRVSSLDAWVEGAGAAVESIDAVTPLGLQRAAVQDALRALADAVLVAEQLGGR